MFKKILKYTGFTFIGLFFALLLAPFIFKDDIQEGIKNAIQDNVNAKVSFESVDISFIKSFPDLKIDIKNLSILGVDTFDGIELLKTEKLALDLDLIELIFGKQPPVINYIGLKNGNAHIMILADGTNNYSILKQDSISQDTASTSFKLEISDYDLTNFDIQYIDQTLPLYVQLDSLHHTGSGDFTETVFDLKTNTMAERITLRYDQLEYIKNAKMLLDAGIRINTDEMSFTLMDNILALNELNLTGDGAVDLNGDSIQIDLKVKTERENIRHLLSAIPSFYTVDFPDVKTEGNAVVNFDMHGIYHGEKNVMPAFQMSINLEKGLILYPGSPFPIQDLNLDVFIGAKDPQYKDLAIKIPKFSCTLLKDRIDGHLNIDHAMSNQAFSGGIKGTLNLANVKQALRLTSFENLQGTIQGDAGFKALMNDIVAENYSGMEASGTITGKNIIVKSKDQPAIQITSLESQFSPKSLEWDARELKVDKGTYQFSGNVKNPLAAFTMDKGIQTKVTIKGDIFDMNAWSSDPADSNHRPEEPGFEMTKNQTDFVNQSTMDLDVQLNKIMSGMNVFEDVKIKGNFTSNLFTLDNLSARLGENDITVHGVVLNAFDYMFSNGILKGELMMVSKNLNANSLLGGPSSNSQETTTNYRVPDNMDLSLTADIASLQYTDISLKNVKGTFLIKNKEASITGFTTETLGGKIQMEGLYNSTVEAHPDYSLKLDLSKIKFAEAFKKLPIFKKLVPIAEYIDGIFNTTLVMKGKLSEGMSPDLSTLDASGFIETLQGKINSFPPLLKIGNTLQIKELKNIDLTDTKNWFEIVRGVLDLKPWKTSIGDIAMDIQGKHSFASGMDFTINMNIPRKLLEKSSVTQAANTGLSFLEKESKKLGIPFSQGDYIPVLVTLKGKLLSPSISIKPMVGSQGNTAGDVLKNQAETAGKQVKDSIEKVFEKEKQKAKDSLNKVIKKESDKLKTKAEEETQKVLDEAKQKAKDKLDTLAKGVLQDTLKKKAEDVLNKNVDKEIDKIKDKLKDFDPFKKKKDKN